MIHPPPSSPLLPVKKSNCALIPSWAGFLPEQFAVLGHEVPHARRRPSCDRLDIGRETVVTVVGVEAGHG